MSELDNRPRCKHCKRPLKTVLDRQRGLGPTCYRKQVLEKQRQEFLSRQMTLDLSMPT